MGVRNKCEHNWKKLTIIYIVKLYKILTVTYFNCCFRILLQMYKGVIRDWDENVCKWYNKRVECINVYK